MQAFECNQCERKFKTIDALKSHYKASHGEALPHPSSYYEKEQNDLSQKKIQPLIIASWILSVLAVVAVLLYFLFYIQSLINGKASINQAFALLAAIVFVWIVAIISYKIFIFQLGSKYKKQLFHCTILEAIYIFSVIAPMISGIITGIKLLAGKIPGYTKFSRITVNNHGAHPFESYNTIAGVKNTKPMGIALVSYSLLISLTIIVFIIYLIYINNFIN